MSARASTTSMMSYVTSIRNTSPSSTTRRLADALAVIDRADLVRVRARLRRRTHLIGTLQVVRVEAGGARRERRHHAALADERAVLWTRFVRLTGRGARLADAVAAGGRVLLAGGPTGPRLGRTVVRAVAPVLVALAPVVTAGRRRADPVDTIRASHRAWRTSRRRTNRVH